MSSIVGILPEKDRLTAIQIGTIKLLVTAAAEAKNNELNDMVETCLQDWIDQGAITDYRFAYEEFEFKLKGDDEWHGADL